MPWDLLWSVAVFLAGIALGAIAGFGFGEYMRRPKLVQGGSGGGGGPKLGHTDRIDVHNAPNFFGVNARETVIFGRIVHRPLMRGLHIERHPAKGCRASLLDALTNERLASLWWQVTVDGKREWVPQVDLGTGDRGEIAVFAREHEGDEYFPFEPNREPGSGSELRFKVPPERQRFQDPKRFVVEIRYGQRQVLRVPVEMLRPYGQPLRFQVGRK